MLGQHKIFHTAGLLASHAAKRQDLLAQNVANADTPGFKARDLHAFSIERTGNQFAMLSTSNSKHFQAFKPEVSTATITEDIGPLSPNGNGVSLESEMVRAADISRQHDLAMTIYSSALGILRTSLGRGR
jgi:flagellar basal-body rod protein FlgB